MEKPIAGWRVMKAFDQEGLLVWFDPTSERLSLRDLTEAEKADMLDRSGSVSGLIRFDQDEITDGCE